MERRLFDDLVVSRPAGKQGRASGIPLSMAVHAVALVSLILLSMAWPDELPGTVPRIIDFPPGPVIVSAPAAPRPPGRPGTRRPATVPRLAVAASVAPADDETYEDQSEITGDPWIDVGCVGCVPGGDTIGDGPPAGGGDGPASEIPPVRVRVGGQVQPPRKIRHVDPVYPELARRAGVTGIVILECVIDREGRLGSVSVLRGHPLLDAAATEAVRQWTYRPTLLNGVPVEIVMTVTVRFATGTR